MDHLGFHHLNEHIAIERGGKLTGCKEMETGETYNTYG